MVHVTLAFLVLLWLLLKLIRRRLLRVLVLGQPSSEHFEQQPEQYEEGKYNMNNLSPLIIISYCILILYAYKDIPSHFISVIYILWVAFWLVVLGCCATTHLVLFN